MKTRLDQLLVGRGLAKSRTQTQALILAGRVQVEGLTAPKAGALVPAAARVTLKESSPFVSRGGEKLAGALDHFEISPADKVALDTGASTGGFTHVLITRGARRVYAVDVGYGQLAPGLRNHPRVVVLEQESTTMLILTVKQVEKVLIGDKIAVMVVEIRGNQIRLGIEAPAGLLVLRGKLAGKTKA